MTFLRSGWYLQIWQYGHGTAAEQNIDDAIQTALKFGAAGISPKVLDGTDWMGHINTGHGVPTSVADVVRDSRKCSDAGLWYLPWVNPLYGDDAFLRREAEIYGHIGAEISALVWDSEPYAGFWGANRPVGAASYLLTQFRGHAPNCFNIWQPDPRPGRLEELRMYEWAQHMNCYTPQSYWTDFGTGVAFEIDRAKGNADSFGIPEVSPTIPGNGAADAVPVALERMGGHGITSCFAWRMGSLSEAHMSWLRDLAPAGPLTGGPEHPPPDEPEHPPDVSKDDQIEMLRILADDVATDRLTIRIASLTERISALDTLSAELSVELDELTALRNEVVRIRTQALGERG